jgi:hypothetical protein
VYRLLFGSKKAAHPMYFHPEADSLFLREYTFSVGVHQSIDFLRQLPDKEHIQQIMLSPYHLTHKFRNVAFPNLKKVILVKKVCTNPLNWDAMGYEHISAYPLYIRYTWDGSSTKVGRTQFLSENELIQFGAIWTWIGKKFDRISEDAAECCGNHLEKVIGRRAKDLEYGFVGAIYDKIPEESIWYRKPYNARSRGNADVSEGLVNYLR